MSLTEDNSLLVLNIPSHTLRDITELIFYGPWEQAKQKDGNQGVILTSLMLIAFAFARTISGISGMMWILVLSASHACL